MDLQTYGGKLEKDLSCDQSFALFYIHNDTLYMIDSYEDSTLQHVSQVAMKKYCVSTNSDWSVRFNRFLDFDNDGRKDIMLDWYSCNGVSNIPTIMYNKSKSINAHYTFDSVKIDTFCNCTKREIKAKDAKPIDYKIEYVEYTCCNDTLAMDSSVIYIYDLGVNHIENYYCYIQYYHNWVIKKQIKQNYIRVDSIFHYTDSQCKIINDTLIKRSEKYYTIQTVKYDSTYVKYNEIRYPFKRHYALINENSSFFFKSYPNPVIDVYYIDHSPAPDYSVSLYDLQMRSIPIKDPKASSIDMSTLPKGVYFVEVQMNGERIREKVIKE
jgi:hypothetical protein